MHTRYATLTTALFTTACTVALAAATFGAAPPAYAEAPIDASGVGPAIGRVRLNITP
jgi:hypothetical protein